MKYVVVFLCIFNVVMWIVFLKKFKKLFTTDNIIEDTKAEYNKLVTDLNRNIDSNVNVIDDRIRTLKSLIAEADKKIRLMNDIEKKGYAVSELQSAMGVKKTDHSSRKVAAAYSKTRQAPQSDAAYALTERAEKSLGVDQKTLFDEDSPQTIDTRAEVNVDGRGSWAKVPVVVPDVYVEENPIPHKKEKKHQIVGMYDTGMTVEEIAEELTLTDTEVQFALSLENRI